MAEAEDFLPAGKRQGRLSFDFIRPPDRRSTFNGTLIEATDEHIILGHRIAPSKPLVYQGHEVMADGYGTVWFLFKDRPYDVGRVYRPDGTWTGYYADVLEPVYWEGSNPRTLRPIVDLFLDLWTAPSGEFEVLDEDEFEQAVADERISRWQATHATQTLREMVAAVRTGNFPPELVKKFRL